MLVMPWLLRISLCATISLIRLPNASCVCVEPDDAAQMQSNKNGLSFRIHPTSIGTSMKGKCLSMRLQNIPRHSSVSGGRSEGSRSEICACSGDAGGRTLLEVDPATGAKLSDVLGALAAPGGIQDWLPVCADASSPDAAALG
jgi:hypothetical protein